MDASQRVPSMHPDTALSAAMAYLESRECCTARDLGQHFGWPPRARDAILQQAIANGYARKSHTAVAYTTGESRRPTC